MRGTGERAVVKSTSGAGVVVHNHCLVGDVNPAADVAAGVTSRQIIDGNDTAGYLLVSVDEVPAGQQWFDDRASDDVDHVYKMLNGGEITLTVHEPDAEEARQITLGIYTTVLVPAGVRHSARSANDQMAHVLTMSYER